MADITRNSIWPDDLITAPLQYAKNVKEAIKEMDSLLASGKKLGESLQAATTISKITEETNKLSKAQKDLEGVQKQVSAQMNDRYKQENKNLDELVKRRAQLSSLIKGNVKDQKEDLQLLKDGVITRKEYNKRLDESNVNIAKYRSQIQSLNKNVKDEIALNSTLGNQYQKLVIQLDQARATYKNMAASGTVSNKVLQDQAKIVTDLNNKIVTIDKAVGQFQRNVGNYPGTFGAAAGALKDFIGALGVISGVALFAKGIKEIISLNAEFAFKNSELQGILGATAKETEGLRKQQVELGKTTLYTATQYTQLQIELAKLGFPIKAIDQMTESTANAALAMGADLGRQAEITGSVLHSFQLDAVRTEEVNDLLAKSTAASALSFESLATTLPYVSASANALGFSLSETLALMGQLANNGLAASTVGTSLRSIFLKLADSSSSLSKKFKQPIRDLPSLLKGLKQLKEEGTDLGEALELTDVRSVNAFKALINGADAVEKLNQAIAEGNIENFAKQLAEIRSDNLTSDFTLLKSATAALAREFGEELDGALRSVVQTLTKLVTIIAQTPKFIRDNAALFTALALAILSFNSAMIISNANAIKDIALKKLQTIWALRLNVTTKQLWATFALNPLGIVLATVAALIAAFAIYEKNSERTLNLEKKRADTTDDLGKAIDRVTKAQRELTFNESEWTRMSKQVREEQLKRVQNELIIADFELKKAKRSKTRVEDIAKELTAFQNLVNFIDGRGTDVYEKSFGSENAAEATTEITQKIKELEGAIIELRGTEQNLFDLEEALAKSRAKNSKDQQKALYDLLIFRKQQELKGQEEIANQEANTLADRLAAVDKATQLRNEISDLERKKELVEVKKFGEETALINEKTEAEKAQAIKDGFAQRRDIAKTEALKDLKDQEDAAKINAESYIKRVQQYIEGEKQIVDKRYIDGKISRERYDREIAAIDRKYNEYLINEQIKVYEELLTEADRYEKDRLKLAEGNSKEQQEIIKSASEEERQILEKIQELRNKLSETQANNVTGLYDKEISQLTKVQAIYETWTQTIGDLFDSLAARRIASIDLQEKRLTEQYNNDIKLAGDNDEAKKKIENEFQARQAELERRRIETARKAAIREKALAIVSAGIQTALAVLNGLQTKPFIPAGIAAGVAAGVLGAAQIAAIAAKPIPQFEKGGITTTETIIAGEKGAELYKTPSGDVGLTPGEATVMNLPVGTKITPADETSRQLAMAGLRTYDTQVSKQSDERMLKELRTLNKTIKNKKETHFNMSQKGAEIMMKNAESRTRWLNDIYK